MHNRVPGEERSEYGHRSDNFSMSKEEQILEVKNLEVGFPQKGQWSSLLHSLHFSIPKGRCLGVVGESGSGKSLTALSMLGLLPRPIRVAGGELLFHSPSQGLIDLLRLSSKQWRSIRGREISMIFQEPMSALNPVISCGRQVEEALDIHSDLSKTEKREKVAELFSLVELPEKTQHAYPHEISGGQKQRVMIAMAMSCNPALLIADEPTTALDVTIQARILSLLRKLQKERDLSLLFISHDLGVVAEIADQVLVMRKGELIEHAEIESLFTHPKHPYSKGLLACRPRLEESWSRLPTIEEIENFFPITNSHEENLSQEKNRVASLGNQGPFLKVEGLKTWFALKNDSATEKWVKAVDEVSFSLYPGETLGLVGESGCGKTTLGRSILNLVSPTDGKVFVEGKLIAELDRIEWRKLRKKFQVIFQDPYSSLNPRKAIGPAILEAMKVHEILPNDRERKSYILGLLERVGLEASHYKRYPHEFSGGQRQRICIARALALDPKCLICDESVSALDVSVQAQVLNLLKDLQTERKLAYLFISHDLAVVKHMSDRIMVMRNGKILERQLAEGIYTAPQTTYTKKLIKAIPQGTAERIRELKSIKSSS